MFVSQLAIKNELNVVEIIALSIDCCCCCSFFQWFHSVLIIYRFKSINEPILFAFYKIFTWQTVIGHLPIILLFDESTYTRVLFILAFNAIFKLYHTHNFNPIYLEAAQIYQEQLLITESRTYFIYCFWYGMIPSREVQILLWIAYLYSMYSCDVSMSLQIFVFKSKKKNFDNAKYIIIYKMMFTTKLWVLHETTN